MRRLLLTLLFPVLAVMGAGATVRHINVRDGLSSRQVYEVEEDSDGYMWIYTNSGLDRFDGHVMKHYPLDSKEEQNDHIQSATSMQTAPDGAVWIVMKSGAIYRYNRMLDRFDVALKFSDPSILCYNFTIVDSDRLVVCTNRGLYRGVPGKGIQLLALDGKLVRAVESDGSGGFYAGTDHGLYHVTPSGGSYRSRFVRGSEGIHVLSLEMSSGKLFVGSFSNGVFTVDSDDTIARLPLNIPSLPINAMMSYDGDKFLIGVDGAGVYLVKSTDGSLLRHYHDADDSGESLSSNTLSDIHVDSDKGIWIATSHNGLNYLPPFTHTVSILQSHRGNRASLISDYVNVIFEDSDGDLWFGTDKGVSCFCQSTGQWKHYMQRSDSVGVVVLSFGEDSHGRILAGTYGHGLNIIDKRTGTVTRMPSQTPGQGVGIGTDYVFAGYGLPDGGIWVGGINGPLTYHNTNDGTYRYYEEDCIATIVPDSDGLLFGGNKGVGTYSSESDSFTWTQTFDSVTIRYPVRVLLPDTVAGALWIGTQGDGLLRYNRRTGDTRRFTTVDGLSSNAIYSLALDNNGILWVCTETDIYRFNPEEDNLMRLTYLLGAPSNRGVFNPAAATSTRSGNIMIGTADGCVVFNPSEQLSRDMSGRILLTDFRLNDKSVEPAADNSPLPQNINLTDCIELTHRQNSFELGFALIDYVSPQRIAFEYMLEGYDHRFIATSAGMPVRYSNLPSGTYTLMLRAIDVYTGSVIAERNLKIVVRPPLWLSFWAVLIYALVFAAMSYVIVSAWQRRRRERRIESQLRSYATLAHDIRTPMSMIKAPLLNAELDSSLSESARGSLRQVRSAIEKTMGMLDEMLGVRREMNGARRLQLKKLDIKEYIRLKIEEYSSLAIYKGITLESDVQPDMPEVMVDADKFDHIVDNLLSNAIKYTAEGKITLSACLQGRKRWSFSVSDTGIGISVADGRHLFKTRHRSEEAVDCDASGTGLGMLITGRLVREHRGTISFVSEQGRGSTFTVTFPVRFAASGRMAAPSDSMPDADDSSGHASDAAMQESKNTVYVVDDNSDMREFLREHLGGEYNVIVSDNPVAALDEIRTVNPDLVISDIVMPRLRGDELCRMLKTNIDTSHIPVILLTGLAAREDILAGLEARADDYIVKPFDISVLKARIRNIIKSRQELGKHMLSEKCEPAKEEFASELDRKFMTRFMEIIDNNMSNSEFSINELCMEMGMSRTSMYNKIKSLSGQSPNEFIRIMRLNRAKELIATRNYNVSEVAYMVGFSDPKYFSTCFRKQFGTSPSKI